MTPAFGFSVGDFISVINLIRKISKALKETGGATAEYQDAIIELKGLKHALQHLEALEPTEDNIRHVNAIRGMALACQLPLRDFMTELEKYETSLGPWSDRTSFRKAGRQTKWAVSFGQEVKKLRALVAAKLMSINLLLATVSSQAVSSMSVRAKRDHGDLMSKIAEQRAALHQVHGKVEHIQDRIKSMEATSQTKLDAISSKSDATQTSVMNLREFAQQVMTTIGTYSQEIRGLLYNIMQADGRTYRAILQIQERLAQSPSSLLDSNIQFTNALGEYRELPYEYFCHWEPFEGFLRAQFKCKPGATKVQDGQFHIIDIKSRGAIVQKEHWSRSVSQGAKLTMSMIMSHLHNKSGQCPRPGCTGVGTRECKVQSQLTCRMCYLKFFNISDGLEDMLSNVTVSEEDIARQQIEEDLRMYGSRPNPPDAIDVDENTKLANLPLKRKASEFEAAVDRPAKARARRESQNFNYETVTAVDWNSGASPLDAWLNQSALPSTVVALENLAMDLSEKDLVAQEEDEIKFFRNVHMAMTPRPKEDEKVVDALEGLEIGPQIYCRNIRDRYPLLPTYLTRRLAQANFRRSERLRSAIIRRRKNIERQLEIDISRMRRDKNIILGLFRSLADDIRASLATGSNHHHNTTEQPRYSLLIALSDFQENMAFYHSIRKKSKVQRLTAYQHRLQEQTQLETTQKVDDSKDQIHKMNDDTYKVKDYIYEMVDEILEMKEDVNEIELIIKEIREQITEEWENTKGIRLRCWDTIGENKPVKFLTRQMKYTIHCTRRRFPISRDDQEAKNTRQESDGNVKKEERPQSYQCLSINLLGHTQERSSWSSTNSSLCGRPTFDPQEQNPTFPVDYQKRSSASLASSSALPSPPMRLGKVSSSYSDFWTGAARIQSPGSSMNSSLHGRPTFDPQEQNPVFPTDCQSGSCASLASSPALPPPPVELGKVLTFNCDICGQDVQVKRRLEWQKHVMSDLRPYVCTFSDCATAEQSYSSLSSFWIHERLHEVENNLEDISRIDNACLFCGEMLPKANSRARTRHVGRHMEEIAFSVVTKPYEDWDFYTESSRKSNIEGASFTDWFFPDSSD